LFLDWLNAQTVLKINNSNKKSTLPEELNENIKICLAILI